MASLTPQHRRSTRTRREPKRFTDEKFISGRVDQYTRGYEGRDSNWRADLEDAENYYHTINGRPFANHVWNSRGKYRVHLRDFPESLLEFSSIWRDFGYEMPDVVLDKIGSFLNISSTDQALLADDDAFITADHDEECEIDNSDEEAMTDGEFYSSEEDEEWSGSDDEDEGKYWAGPPYFTDGYGTEEDNNDTKCGLKRKEPSSPTKVSFSSSDDEIHETYSSKEYNRTNFDFYDAIRRRDRVDEKWRRIIMRVYAKTLR